jgi:hypothetical protein
LHFTMQTLNLWLATYLRALFEQWYRKNSEKTFLFHLHNIAHPGRLASWWLVSSRYVWRCLAKDVSAWANTCLRCQQSKIHCQARTQPLHIPVPQRVSLTFTLIWWARCNTITIATIFLPLLSVHSKWMEAVRLFAISVMNCA